MLYGSHHKFRQAVFSKNQTKEIKHQYVNNILTERMLETSCPSGDTSIFWDIYCDNDHFNDPFHYNEWGYYEQD